MSFRQLKQAWKRKLMSANIRGFFADWTPQKIRSLLNPPPQLKYAREYERQKVRDNVSEILD
jgi:hypothetical protein